LPRALARGIVENVKWALAQKPIYTE
jgi:hypothetical protein